MRGRKPVPTVVKKLRGNPARRPLNTHEPAPPELLDLGLDAPPAELADDAVAAAEWARLVPMLRRCRQITEADRAGLLACCIEWSRYLEANAAIRRDGLIVSTAKGGPMTNPYLRVTVRSLSALSKLWAELGLTPSSRSRVRTNDAPPADDPFAEFDAPPLRAMQ